MGYFNQQINFIHKITDKISTNKKNCKYPLVEKCQLVKCLHANESQHKGPSKEDCTISILSYRVTSLDSTTLILLLICYLCLWPVTTGEMTLQPDLTRLLSKPTTPGGKWTRADSLGQ